MKPVITAAESARLDRESTTPVSVLMERAGLAVANAAVRMGAGYGSRVVVLAGPGNNGGDGFVAAKHLRRRGAAVTVHSLGAPSSEVARTAASAASRAGVPIRPISDPEGRAPDLVIDALFGGGFRDSIPAAVVPWLDVDAPVLAVDVPSGLDPDTGRVGDRAFRAGLTVTFHALCPGHLLGSGPDHCGEIEVVDIGLEGGEPAFHLVEQTDARRPAHDRTDHKWSSGAVLVLGGSQGMIGAAVMAARAALHFGAGAVGISSASMETAQLLAPEILAYPAGTIPDRYDVVVVGPGLGEQSDVVGAALDSGRPLVVDADALAQLPDGHRFSQPAVLTPHAGEFRHLTGQDPDPAAAGDLAASMNAVVVMKGNPTIVSDGRTPRVVMTGGPELATIGTGDVLSGMIGALMARGLDASAAACSGVYWHGVAGDDLHRSTAVTADVLSTHVGRFAWGVR